MNYIGSKYKLINFITETINDVVGNDLSEMVFCDLFAGTGIVGRSFKQKVKQVISNDCEYYSYVLNRNYIGNHLKLKGADKYIEYLNKMQVSYNGFIYKNYSLGGSGNRQYFSDINAARIDSIRLKIEEWKYDLTIDENAYFFLLCSLLESADKVANTASVYGAFLKKLKKTAIQDLVLKPALFDVNSNSHLVFRENANNLIKRIKGDILYLDPPYNSRQYGANYHLLNTIAEYKEFIPKGKTGLREYSKSKYCAKKTVCEEFENLIKNANFKFVFLSYNNEGLMAIDDIKSIMQKYGTYSLVQKKYQRFKADKEELRNHKADYTIEYLHILEKN